MLRLALYGYPLYGYYLRWGIAARSFRYIQVGYAVGLIDDAVRGALAESVADRGLVVVQAVRADFRRADHATAQVLDKIVRSRAVALASAIANNRPRGRCERHVGVLVPEHRGGLGGAFLRISLVADVGPQLVTLDPVDVQADHHAVMQFCAATADGERQPGDGLAIGVREAADGTLADALTEHADDFNLLVEEGYSWRPNPSHWGKWVACGNSGPKLLYSLRSDTRGRNPEVEDQGLAAVDAATGPLIDGAGSQVRTDVSRMYPSRPYR